MLVKRRPTWGESVCNVCNYIDGEKYYRGLHNPTHKQFGPSECLQVRFGVKSAASYCRHVSLRLPQKDLLL